MVIAEQGGPIQAWEMVAGSCLGLFAVVMLVVMIVATLSSKHKETPPPPGRR